MVPQSMAVSLWVTFETSTRGPGIATSRRKSQSVTDVRGPSATLVGFEGPLRQSRFR